MKHLIKKVDLVFFQDDASGLFGLAHKETFNDNNAFNAFWNAIGIFHDVFEHSHEFTNKYFRGDYAMNIGGEMAAMGSMWYYIDELGIGNRLRNSMYSPGDSMRDSTLSDVHEYIASGYVRYGHTLESNVPKQRPVDNSEMEYQIGKYWDKVQEIEVNANGEQEKEDGITYKNSVTFRKIADLHRYGYRMAAKLVPNNWDNQKTLTSFLEFFETFCKNNSAETLANAFKGMIIKLYKDENGFISWTAKLYGNNDVKDMKINTSDCIEDEIVYTY